jgi:hypothetical protein
LIFDIQKKFGTIKKFQSYPSISFFNYFIKSYFLLGLKKINPLNYIDYNKSKAISFLQKEMGWQYYGGKHYESVFTKFFQSYYLPKRFGYDKRLAHLSSLILSGEISRDEALVEIEQPLYNEKSLKQDIDYICKKLDIDIEYFENLLNAPKRSHKDFANNEKKIKFLFSIYNLFRNNK